MAGKILVLGATGNVGRRLVKALLAKGETIKAASRAGKPVEGVEGIAFDYADTSGFAAAFDGVDRACVLLASGLDGDERWTSIVSPAGPLCRHPWH